MGAAQVLQKLRMIVQPVLKLGMSFKAKKMKGQSHKVRAKRTWQAPDTQVKVLIDQQLLCIRKQQQVRP